MRGGLASPEVPRVSWETLKNALSEMDQGDHVSLIGPTKRGKSTLAMRGILPVRYRQGGYVVILDPKGDDKILHDRNFQVVKRWPPRGVNPDKRLFRLSPAVPKMEDISAGRAIFSKALDDLFAEGKWTIYVDECRWLADRKYMGLESKLDALWMFGRTRHATLVASSQQPVHVPGSMYEMATHLFIWKNADDDARKRLGEISGGNRRQIQDTVMRLGFHEFLYVDLVHDRMMISEVRL